MYLFLQTNAAQVDFHRLPKLFLERGVFQEKGYSRGSLCLKVFKKFCKSFRMVPLLNKEVLVNDKEYYNCSRKLACKVCQERLPKSGRYIRNDCAQHRSKPETHIDRDEIAGLLLMVSRHLVLPSAAECRRFYT